MGPFITNLTYGKGRKPLYQIKKRQLPISQSINTSQTLLQARLDQLNVNPLAIVSEGSWRPTGTVRQQIFEIDPINLAGATVGLIETTRKSTTNTIISKHTIP